MVRSSSKSRPYVAYYRVSTRRQGASGLGLDAQRECVERMVEGRGGRLVAAFTEVESGRRTDRPELHRALAECRAHGGTLIVAKLDRLARNASFLLSLRDAGVDVLACDLPDVNRLVVGVMALVAEEEARLIGERTRAALAAAKRRGVRLGNPANLSDRARRKGTRVAATVRVERADQRAQQLAHIVGELRAEGATSLRKLAAGLDARGIETPRGSRWTAAAVARLLDRLEGRRASA